jgi:hypothetical protein
VLLVAVANYIFRKALNPIRSYLRSFAFFCLETMMSRTATARYYDDRLDDRVIKKRQIDSEFRFLRSTEGITQATSEVKHCIKIIQKQDGNSMDLVVENLNRVVLLLNTVKDRLRADATISGEAEYVHNRTKRNRGSLLEEEGKSTMDQAGAQRKRAATVPHSQGTAGNNEKQNEGDPNSAVASVQHAEVAAASTAKAQVGVATANPAPAPSRERTIQEILHPVDVPFDTIENPLDANGNEPQPVNGHHYDLFEAISILKFKTPATEVSGRWHEEGKLKCTIDTVRKRLRRARVSNKMPVRGDYGNRLEYDKEEDDPIPANGRYYCLHEIVTYLSARKGPYKQTLLRWIKTGKILCSSKTVRKRIQKARKTGILPLQGDYGNTPGSRGFLDVTNISELHGLTTREEIKAKVMEIQKRELQKRGEPLSKLKEPSWATILNYKYLMQFTSEQGEEEEVDGEEGWI